MHAGWLDAAASIGATCLAAMALQCLLARVAGEPPALQSARRYDSSIAGSLLGLHPCVLSTDASLLGPWQFCSSLCVASYTGRSALPLSLALQGRLLRPACPCALLLAGSFFSCASGPPTSCRVSASEPAACLRVVSVRGIPAQPRQHPPRRLCSSCWHPARFHIHMRTVWLCAALALLLAAPAASAAPARRGMLAVAIKTKEKGNGERWLHVT